MDELNVTNQREQAQEEKGCLYQFRTKMEPEDGKRFLYLDMFYRKGKAWLVVVILLILAISAVLSSSFGWFLVYLVFYSAVAGLAVWLKIEYIHRKQVQTDRMGLFGTWTDWSFYDDHIVCCREATNSSSVFRYDQFYQVAESRDYFMMYPNERMANLIRKKDLEGYILVGLQMLLREKMKARYRVIQS